MSRIPRLRAVSGLGRLGVGALLGLAVGLLVHLARGTELVEGLELRAVDLRTRHVAGRRAPDPRIVLMQVEESDVAQVRDTFGAPWPWSLQLNTYLVDVLAAAGARCLVVDLFHLDRGAGPDDLPEGPALSMAERQRRQLEAHDAEAYGQALATFGRAAVAFELSAEPRYDLPARRQAALERLGSERLRAPPEALGRGGAEWPVLGVTRGAALLGFANTPQDADGIARRGAALGRYGERTVLSLPLAAARLVTDSEATLDEGALTVGATTQALMDDATFLLDYRSASVRGAYPRIAPAQVLAWADEKERTGRVPVDAHAALEGRIVVFGVNLPGVKDLVACPLGGSMDGPVHQATALDNLLHGDGRVRASAGTNLALLLAWTLLVGALGGLLRGVFLPHLVPAAGAALLVGLAFVAFDAGTSLDLVTPMLGILLTWIGTSAVHVFTEGRRNRWLESTFSHYMARPIIEELKRDPTLLELGGREREITVLFSDVARFTRLSAKLTPQQVVALLNRYLTDHCAAVMEEGGVVDKFEGDAVMAFFGDPVPGPDHAMHACRTALRVLAGLPALEPVWRPMGLDGFRVRIGLNTGNAVVGNMGSDQRFDYTCMGDAVNVASRLEGGCKVYGTSVLIGPRTAAAVKDRALLKPLGELVVVGREEPLAVAELVAVRDEATEALTAHVAAFGRALDATRADDLDAAAHALEEARRLRLDDGPCLWLGALLDDLEQGRLPRPWGGVTIQAAK